MHTKPRTARAAPSSSACTTAARSASPRTRPATLGRPSSAAWLGALAVLLSACTPAPRAALVAEKARVAPRVAAPAGETPAPATGSGMQVSPARFAEDILAAHNRKRCLHGAPPLQWHPGVAAYAQNWVNRGGFAHSPSYEAPIGPLGENLYGASGMVPTGADAVEAWYAEVANYRAGAGFSPNTGHYTALIWKDAKYLGCGQSGGRIFCNYWSGSQARDCSVPNMQGCEREQVLPRLPAARVAACQGQS